VKPFSTSFGACQYESNGSSLAARLAERPGKGCLCHKTRPGGKLAFIATYPQCFFVEIHALQASAGPSLHIADFIL